MKITLTAFALLIVGVLVLGGGLVAQRTQANQPQYKLVCPEGTVLLTGWSAGNGYCATGSYPTRVRVD